MALVDFLNTNTLVAATGQGATKFYAAKNVLAFDVQHGPLLFFLLQTNILHIQ